MCILSLEQEINGLISSSSSGTELDLVFVEMAVNDE